MEILASFLFIDIPEAFVLLLVGLSVFNLSIKTHWKKAFLISIFYAIPSFFLTYLDIYVPFKTSALYFWMILLIYLFMQTGIGLSVGICTSSFVLLNIAQFLLILAFSAFSISLEKISENPFLLMSVIWSYLLGLLLLGYILRKKRFDLRQLFPKTIHNRYLILLIIVGSIELLAILWMNTTYIIERINPFNSQSDLIKQLPVFHVTIMILFIIMIILFRIYLKLTINRVESETQTPYLQNIDDLVTAIRSIKHDAINHFTAIDGLLKVKRYDLATDYIKHLLTEASHVITVVEGVKNPAVSALFHSKMAICLANYITFNFEISSNSQFSVFKTMDLITIIGNLLDNSTRATLQESEENRRIDIKWKDEDNYQYFIIENTGPTIPSDKLLHVFDLGYTTKTSGEGGVGLAVVKSVIDKYNGNIIAYSKEGITRFTIKVPI